MSDTVTGVLKCTRSGGVLRDPAKSFRQTNNDPWVSTSLIRKHGLETGAVLTGPVRIGRNHDDLTAVDTVNGLDPAVYKKRTHYRDLVAIDPEERFNLAVTNNMSMRVIDLIAPIGKGTRGLVVSPPKAGKTMILQEIARSINADEPDTRIIVLLIDERPEEVTCFRRAVKAEVFASSNDQTAREHVELSEMTLGYIKTELEFGNDVVVLVDSLTRMGRAFNVRGSGTGRTMSGGVEAGEIIASKVGMKKAVR